MSFENISEEDIFWEVLISNFLLQKFKTANKTFVKKTVYNQDYAWLDVISMPFISYPWNSTEEVQTDEIYLDYCYWQCQDIYFH